MGSRPSVACHSGRWVATPNDRDGAICHADVSFGGCSVCRPGMPACAGEWHVATATATLCSTVCSADATQTHSLRWDSVACSLFEARRWATLAGTDRPACVGTSATPPFARAAAAAARHLHRPSTQHPDSAHICAGDFAHICAGRDCARSAVSGGVAYPWAAKARLDVPAQQISTVRLCGIQRGQESARECRRVPSCWKAVGSWHGTGSGSDKHRRCDTKRERSDMMAYQCRQVYHQSS
jgi:hypothetical protein